MKRKIRKITAFIAVLAILITLSVPMFSVGARSENEIVARMYACSRWSGPPSLGHIWIYIENLSDGDQKVGLYTMHKGEGVSLGCFGLTRSDGFGTHYNVEAYCGNKYGLSGTLSISCDLTAEKLSSVSNKVLNSNHWDPFFNCITFAFGVWNAGSSTQLPTFLVFPALARLFIRMNGGKEGLTMYYPPANRCYKQHGTGSSATLTVCVPGTLDSQVG